MQFLKKLDEDRKKNNTDSAPDSDKEGERPVTDIIYFVSAWVPDQY